jgi:O-antigen ligase
VTTRTSPTATADKPELTERGLATDLRLPQLLFLLLVATVPFFRWRQLPGPEFMKLDWLLMAALLLFLGPYLLLHKSPPARLRSNIWLPLALFLIANLVANLVSPYPEQSWSGFIGLLQGSLFILVATLMLNDRSVTSTLPLVLGLSVGLNALFSAMQYFLGIELFDQTGVRSYGATISANNMALMCIFTLPLMIYWGIFGPTPNQRWLGRVLAVLLVMGVFSTVSRGGFLGMILVLVLVAVQYRRRFHPRYLGLLVAGLAIAAIMVVSVLPQDFFERQASLVTQGTEDESVSRRSYYIQVGWEAFQQRPIIGWGTSSFQEIWVRSEVTRLFNMEKRPAHNTYMEVAVGSGLLGLAAFGLLLGCAYWNYRTADRLLRAQGHEAEAHLMGAYKLGMMAVLFYFLIKSGLEHKHYLLALPLSHAALSYARRRVSGVLPTRSGAPGDRGHGPRDGASTDPRQADSDHG